MTTDTMDQQAFQPPGLFGSYSGNNGSLNFLGSEVQNILTLGLGLHSNVH